MGRFYGKHIPDEHDSRYFEKDYPPELEYIAWYHLGYADGYSEGNSAYNAEADEKLRRENLQLRGDIEALCKTKEDMREEFQFIDKIIKQYDTQDKAPE